MKPLVLCMLIVVILSGCGGSNTSPEAPTEAPTEVATEVPTAAPTEAPTEVATEVPTAAPTEVATEVPTAAPTEAPTAALKYESLTAGDWANMDQGTRAQAAQYWLDFWKKQGFGTALTSVEMEVCIGEKIIDPETRLTMLIMAISGDCTK